MPAVTTIGEVLLRLKPPNHLRLAQTPFFEVEVGGAEANVAVMIAQLGGVANFVTRVPRNDLAVRAIAELRGLGVRVEGLAYGGERLGLYFMEQGASQRAGKVIYDRAHSSMAEARPEHFDWEAVFRGAKWFHWSGITPALSEGAAALMAEACRQAKHRGLLVSFDLNYRAKLWDLSRAGATLRPMMEPVDLCITSVEEARTVFGLELDPAAPNREEDAAQRLCAHFGFSRVALTMRLTDSASTTRWGAMLYAEGKAHFSRQHEITIVDRVGAGDSFTGALIFALARGDAPEKAIEFAVAASTLKHTIVGDFCLTTLEEVEAVAAGGGGGRVQR